MISDLARKQLISLRKDKKKTQLEMAKILGYESSKAYYELESGKTALKVEHLEKVSNFFGIDPSYFFIQQ